MSLSYMRHAPMMAAVLGLCLAGTARAGVLFELDTGINGDSPTRVDNSLPALTALFENAGTNTVKLTLSAENLIAQEFVPVWLFNFDGDATGLSIFPLPGKVVSIDKSATQSLSGGNQIKAGLFNLQVNFDTSQANRFYGGFTVVITITGAGITETDFSVLSADKPSPNPSLGGWYTAADIRGIPFGNETTSGSIGGRPGTQAVPEPSSVILFTVGALGAIAARRFRKREV